MVKLNGTKYLVDARAYGEGPVQALALKTAEGDPKYGDMSHLSNYVQSDWRGGRGEQRGESGNRFYDSGGLATWIQGQVTLRPRAILIGTSTDGYNVPGASNPVEWEEDSDIALDKSSVTKLAQSLQTAANQAVTEVCLLLRAQESILLVDTSAALTLRVETDSSGSPSGTLVDANATATATVSLTPVDAWYKFAFAGSFTLTATTSYWLVLSYSGAPDANIRWATSGVVGGSVYANGAAKKYISPSWFSMTGDMYFIFGEVSDLPAAPVTGIVFNSIFYLAAGTGVYKITAGVWAGVKTDFANAITDLDVLDNVLWISTGAGNVAWTMTTGESFTAQTGILGQLVYVFDGYLYRANQNDLYYYDGVAWSAALEIGDDTQNITGLCGLNKSLLIARPDGLYGYTSGLWAYNIIRWDAQLDSNNGTGMVEWNGAVYIPVKYGLVKYDGNTFVSMGPDGGEGLPNNRIGKIVSMVPLLNYLIAVVDNTAATGYGSVLLYNGHGWHEVGRAWWAAARVKMVAYDWVSSPNRLYYGMGNHVAYLEFSDKAENPASFLPTAFEPSGYLETAWLPGGLLDVWKILGSIWGDLGLLGPGSFYDAGALYNVGINVDYQADRSGIWVEAQSANHGTGTLEWARGGGKSTSLKKTFTITDNTVQTIGTDGTITLDASIGVGGIAQGKWVRVADETRQTKSISPSTPSFLPTLPYDYVAAADTVTGGYATARESKFRLRFYSKDVDTSPVLRAFRFDFANQLNAWWRWSLRIKIGDKLLLPNGTRDTRTAATLRTGLKNLALETNQLVDFVDIYDASYKTQLVKMEIQPASYKEDGSVAVESMALVELAEV